MRNRGLLADEWSGRARSDLRAARRSVEAEDCTTTLAVLIHQAKEKHVKGFLVYHGWKLKKTHNLVELISAAAQFEPLLESFLPFARSATVYYLDDRYPGQHPSEYPGEEMREALRSAEDVVRRIEESMRSHEPD